MLSWFQNRAGRVFAPPPQQGGQQGGDVVSGRAVAYAVAGAMILVFWGLHLTLIPEGGITMYDEFYTLDRSAGFERHDDWLTVYNKNQPGFRKPPLQYWMTALLMKHGADLEVALRLPSMIFALGALVTAGWLAAILVPHVPWAVPAAVLLCASSLQFWRLSASAMLDAGATLFTILTLIAAMLALRRPRCWYAMAVAAGLGALQKAPVGLVFVLILIWLLNLTRARHGFSYAKLKESPHFLRGLRLAAIAVLAWPLYQTILYGGEALEDLYGGQMAERFVPVRPFKDPRTGGDLWNLIIVGEPVFRVLAIVALMWMPWRLRRPEFLPLAMVFAIYVVAMGLASGSVYPRYSLIFVPLLAAALAAVAMSLFRVRWVGALGIVAVVAAGGGPIRSATELEIAQDPRLQTQISELTRVAGQLTPAETLVTCNWNRETRFFPGAVSYYAAVNGRPFVGLDTPQQIPRWVEGGRMNGPLRGVCTDEELDQIADGLDDLRRGERHSGYVHWTAAGPR